MSAAATSIDPLFFRFVPNIQVRSHIFNTLVYADALGRMTPDLAESWTPADATTWEFRLVCFARQWGCEGKIRR
jgi:peptide/nickel transport system substrate-binding protein